MLAAAWKTFQGMKLMISILAMAGILAGPIAALGQTSTQPTVFVAPLDGDTTAIMAWNPALGEGLAEMLITELTRLNGCVISFDTKSSCLQTTGQIRQRTCVHQLTDQRCTCTGISTN